MSVGAHGVLAVEGKRETGLFVDNRVNGFQARAQLFERNGFAKREVEVFGESVVGEITALKRGTSFESEDIEPLFFGHEGFDVSLNCAIAGFFFLITLSCV